MKNEPSIIKELLCEYRDIILYIIVGAITTAINYISYLFFLNAAGLSNIVSSVISWFLSVTFSFIANKLIVFKSKSFMPLIFFKEAAEFFGCRIATGFLDLGIMYYGVDRMGVLSNVFFISINS